MATEFYHEEFVSRIDHKGRGAQADLARFAEVSPASVNSWYKGEDTPLPDNIRKIAKFFGCRVSDISNLPDEEHPSQGSGKMEAQPTQIVTITGDLDNQVVSIKLTANQRSLLKAFEKIPEEDQLDAASMLQHYSRLEPNKRSEMLVCAIQGKTCKDGQQIDIKQVINDTAKAAATVAAETAAQKIELKSQHCPTAGSDSPSKSNAS
jgi:DNA-binding XRE family transcriptional regulator